MELREFRQPAHQRELLQDHLMAPVLDGTIKTVSAVAALPRAVTMQAAIAQYDASSI